MITMRVSIVLLYHFFLSSIITTSYLSPFILRQHSKYAIHDKISKRPSSSFYQFSSILSSASTNINEVDEDEESSSFEKMGLNELQTLLRTSVQNQNYKQAATLRNIIQSKIRSSNTSWSKLGTAPWLIERLDALEYVLPTTMQIHAMECVNAMLLSLQQQQQQISSSSSTASSDISNKDDDDYKQQTMEERMEYQLKTKEAMNNLLQLSIVISGSTGSGKSLGFLIPMLSTLSNKLFQRQRIRVKAEEDVLDVADDFLLNRVIKITSPEILGKGVTGSGTGIASSTTTLGRSEGFSSEDVDIKSPLALIVVPTRELGVQMATLLYELVGGNVKKNMDDYIASKRNMFKYKGPKGVKIGCIIDDNEAQYGLKLQTDIVITTPQYITKLLNEGDINPSKLQVVIFDEADLALEQMQLDDLTRLLDVTTIMEEEQRIVRLLYLVGASVTNAIRSLPNVNRDWILPDNGRSYIATATDFAPLTFDTDDEGTIAIVESKASLTQLKLSLDPGLIHERVIVSKNTGLLTLCRMLRRELQEYTNAIASSTTSNKAVQRPRAIVFFPNEAVAQKSLSKIRDAMWGDFKLCALLPTIGTSPLQIMEQFANNETHVMLATPNSVRGLDFPNVTHVYTVNYLPDDPREYIHLAGRVGRIGQLGSVSAVVGGKVTCVVTEEEGRERMDHLSDVLGFNFVDLESVEEEKNIGFGLGKNDEDGDENDDGPEVDWGNANVEDMRRYLEDKITLLDSDSTTTDEDTLNA